MSLKRTCGISAVEDITLLEIVNVEVPNVEVPNVEVPDAVNDHINLQKNKARVIAWAEEEDNLLIPELRRLKRRMSYSSFSPVEPYYSQPEQPKSCPPKLSVPTFVPCEKIPLQTPILTYGMVKWFSREEGYGFITLLEGNNSIVPVGNIFFYRAAIQTHQSVKSTDTDKDFQNLKAGDRVLVNIEGRTASKVYYVS
jgi:hypothetical protein